MELNFNANIKSLLSIFGLDQAFTSILEKYLYGTYRVYVVHSFY